MLGFVFSSFPCGTASIAPDYNFYRLYFAWVNGLVKVDLVVGWIGFGARISSEGSG